MVRKSGWLLNHKTVRKLMLEMGLKSPVRRKKYRSYKGEVGRIAENLLGRNFKARRPGEKWVTDVTEFNVMGEKLYLSPVLDLFSGEIIAWETSGKAQVQMVSKMLKKAMKRVIKDQDVMLHSDQGWHYQMKGYQSSLKKKGIRQSMSRKGNCLDNAVMENFFGHLKAEMYYRKLYITKDELEKDIAEYIDYWNLRRIKLSLGGLSPVEYRTQYEAENN